MERRILVAVVLGVMFLPATARAQSDATGSIAGVVRDTTMAVLPGVTVEAASAALIEKIRTVVTDTQGQYKIVDLRPGTYTVTFTLAGFSVVKREGIELTSGFTAAVNAELRVGSLEETITVRAGSPLVDVQNARTQDVLSRDLLDTLPTDRTYYGMAAVTVGIKASISGGGQDVGGTSGDAHGYLVSHNSRDYDGYTNWDGMPFNATYNNSGGSSKQYFIDQAAVQEVTLSTSGMSAETLAAGVNLNVVPKDGGNRFSLYSNDSYTNKSLQGSNLDDALRARGVTTGVPTKQVYDYGSGLGGPIKKDTLWFYTAHRWWGAQTYAPGNYYNKTPNTMFYTPDTSRPAFTDFYQEDHSLRLTWQAAAKQKFTVSHSVQKNCACGYFVQYGLWSPEAARDYTYWPIYLTQATWSFPATNRLLVEAGISALHNRANPRNTQYVLPSDISITELSTNYTYNAYNSANLTTGGRDTYDQTNERFSVSYVTGSHAFKVGLFTLAGPEKYEDVTVNNDLSYQFRNAIPVSLTQWATPFNSEQRTRLNLGFYGQDQWTLRRLTLNVGLRFDYLNSYVPQQTRPGGQFVGAFTFAEIDNVPKWTDLSPRLGAAYDLFGNGRTAIRGSIGRYVLSAGSGLAYVANPANSIVGAATRTWNDANGNYVPDCNLHNAAANGECGPLTTSGFGTVNIVTRNAADITQGFGVRPYNWLASLSVQQEIRPGMALTAGYFHRSYGNFFAQQNVAVTANDFAPYCVTAPQDSRLPGGGGYQVCGLYDVNPSALGRVNNLVTRSSNFGKQSDVFDGLDLTVSARFGRGALIQGGMSTGRTVTDACYLSSQPQLSSGFQSYSTPTIGASLNTPLLPDYCRAVMPWSALTEFKVSGVYPLPGDTQVAATFQNLPGAVDGASFVATNAQIAPSLGRNLAACGNVTPCGATVVVSDLLAPNTMFEDRLSQFDIRFSKIVRVGRARVQGMLDIYNLFNANSVLSVNTRLGPNWLRPASVLGARLFKFGVQLDF